MSEDYPVPPHFSRNSLDTLPQYATAYLDEDEIFVNPDGSLSVHGEATLTQENLSPRDSLVGKVAIQRYTIIDPATNALESSFIATLPMLPTHQCLMIVTLVKCLITKRRQTIGSLLGTAFDH